MTRCSSVVAALLSFATLALAAPGLAQTTPKPEPRPAPTLAGEWSLVADVPNNTMTSTLALKADPKDAKRFTGVISGQSGEMPIEAEFADAKITMWLSFPTSSGQAVNVTFSGAFREDGSIGGTLEYGQGSVPWRAARIKSNEAAAASVAGKWILALEMSQGTATPAIELKQDGERLTGTYTSRYGVYQLQGTIKARTVEFGFTMSADGTPVPMTFTGELAADGQSMKGSATLGELGAATWTAKRDGGSGR
jgi:hypothetical protein